MSLIKTGWEVFQDKAQKALEEARYLREGGFYDGSYNRALCSCLYAAKATSIRLQKDGDPMDYGSSDYLIRLSKMFKDGRLPEGLEKPFQDTLHAYKKTVTGHHDATNEEAISAIELAETFHRVVRKWADLSESFYSPKVRAAARKKGIAMPTTLSALQAMNF